MLSKLRKLYLHQLVQHKKWSVDALQVLIVIQELILVHQAGQDPIGLLYNNQYPDLDLYLIVAVQDEKSTNIVKSLAIAHVSLRG
jgi:hypothetical protein